MPKRSAQDRIERYARKIRKLEERQKRRRIISPLDSSDDEGKNDADQIAEHVDPIVESPLAQELSQDLIFIHDSSQKDDHQPGAIQNEPTPNMDHQLDPDLLSALGESISDSPEYGENIHLNLSNLWLPLLKRGMTKESKEKIINEYPIPDNCRLLQSPKLNEEISAAVPDMVRNRDKAIAINQQQLGIGITAINRGLDILLKGESKIDAMKHFSNGCRLLCDHHNLVTKNRIKLITPSLDKTILRIISDSDRDCTLFGESLSEKIKAAKAIEKQGQQIKKPTIKPQRSTPTQSNARSTPLQGNWPAPPRFPPAIRGGRGGYKRSQSTTGSRRSFPSTAAHKAAIQDRPRALAPNHR